MYSIWYSFPLKLVLAHTVTIVLVEFVHPGTLEMAAMKNAHVEQCFAIQNMGVQKVWRSGIWGFPFKEVGGLTNISIA